MALVSERLWEGAPGIQNPWDPAVSTACPEMEIADDRSLGNHVFLRSGIFMVTHKPCFDKIFSKPSKGWGACKRNIENAALDMKSTSKLREHGMLYSGCGTQILSFLAQHKLH